MRKYVAFIVTGLVAALGVFLQAEFTVWLVNSMFMDSLSVAKAVLVLAITICTATCVLLVVCFYTFRVASFLLSKVVLPKEIPFLNRQMA
ncbi:hypothetical protein K2Q08_01120 [Patescibacteria group bacterium]|nr:hypothetical protein [Patescibacteria group bacterium]